MGWEPSAPAPAFPECRRIGAGSPVVEQPGATSDRAAHEAFARYVLPELDVLARVATSITRRPADAEDLVQDTLLRAYRSIEGFDGRHPRAWLLTIMRNAEVNRNRRRRPELLDDPDLALGRLADASSRSGRGPEEIVLGAQFDGVVADAFLALPDKFRRALELVDLDGLTYAEAAGMLGVPEGTVMSRVHRGRKRIRVRLGAPRPRAPEKVDDVMRRRRSDTAGCFEVRASAAGVSRRRD